VDKAEKKPIIGILGGVCSGKSTVAKEFAKLGCSVIDADRIAHELLDEKGVAEKIVAAFGRGILDSKGKIDRGKLAEIAFADAGRLSSLNEIIHPPVLQQAEELISQFQKQSQIRAIVLDMPLLVEVGWDKRCDKLIFVNCDRQLRTERAKKALFLNENQLKIRENFQISLDSKANLADNTIYNNSDLLALAKQVADIFSYVDNE